MSDDTHPLTRAWSRVRDRVETRAREYREDGYAVVSALADHAAVTAPTDAPVSIAFVVPDDTAATVERAAADRSFDETEVRYVDVENHRLFLLEVRDTAAAFVVLVAGGVTHRELTGLANPGTRPVRTRLRRSDGSTALVLEHERVAPFVAGLE